MLLIVIFNFFHFGAIVTSNGPPYTTGPLSCLSVMLVYCGQIVSHSTPTLHR